MANPNANPIRESTHITFAGTFSKPDEAKIRKISADSRNGEPKETTNVEVEKWPVSDGRKAGVREPLHFDRNGNPTA